MTSWVEARDSQRGSKAGSSNPPPEPACAEDDTAEVWEGVDLGDGVEEGGDGDAWDDWEEAEAVEAFRPDPGFTGRGRRRD